MYFLRGNSKRQAWRLWEMKNNEQSEDQHRPKDLLGDFEAPIWAHRHMRKMGLNPLSMEDWPLFKEHCE